MAEADFVRAAVIDITRPGSVLPPRIVTDANVLYFAYADFSDLQLAGGRGPQLYQTRDYGAWFKRAFQNKTACFASAVTFGEFLRLVEYVDLEARWLTDPARTAGELFSPQVAKRMRYTLTPFELEAVRKRAELRLAAARKSVDLLPRWEQVTAEMDAARAAWIGSAGDFGDAILVANARYVSIPHVLSDDIDLLSFDGITVHTANRRSIDAARQAGKLKS
jgi:hypothetical protein